MRKVGEIMKEARLAPYVRVPLSEENLKVKTAEFVKLATKAVEELDDSDIETLAFGYEFLREQSKTVEKKLYSNLNAALGGKIIFE